MRPLATHCLLGLGRLHLRTGNVERGREHTGAARTSFEAIGMTFWAEGARAVLEASG
jgi:hypothetical protein